MFGKGNYEILKTPLYKEDVLDWVDKKSYKERLKQAKKKTNQDCAVLVAKGKLKDYSGAISDFNKAIEINPQDADAYTSRSGTKLNLGDNQGALNDANQSIEINPQNCYNSSEG